MTISARRERRRRWLGPLARRVLLALVLAALWAWWAWLPQWPLAAWRVPYSECDGWRNFLSGDGTTILTVATTQKKIMSGIKDWWIGPVRLRDAATGRERVRVLDAEMHVNGALLAPDGSWLLTLDQHQNLLLWDAATGRRRAELWPPGTQPSLGGVWLRSVDGYPHDATLAVSPDGGVIAASILPDRESRLWDAATGRPLVTLADACPPLAFTSDGRALLTTTTGTSAKLWDVATGRELLNLPDHPSPVGSVAVSPDGRLLATGPSLARKMAPPAARLWDARTGRHLATLDITGQPPHAAPTLRFSPDGQLLVVRSLAGGGLVWDVTTDPPQNRDDLIALTDHANQSSTGLNSCEMSFAPGDRGWWLTAGRSLLRASPSNTAPRVATGLSHGGQASSPVVFAPDGRTFAVYVSYPVWSGDQQFRNWVRRFLGQPRAWDQHSIHVFDEASGRELGRLPTIDSMFGYVILGFTPDGRTFWTRRSVEATGEDQWVFEQWAVTSPVTPWLLVGVTMLGVLLAVADWRRSRRTAIMEPGGRVT